MSNESTITVAGHIGSEPRYFEGEADSSNYVSFRLATTKSYFNRSKNTWVEGETTWFTVKAWRALAKNVKESLAKGDAVLVHGNLDTQRWTTQDGTNRETLVIEAVAIGPNLARGTAKFRPQRASLTDGGSDGVSASSLTVEEIEVIARNALTSAGLINGQSGDQVNDESLTNDAIEEPKLALTA